MAVQYFIDLLEPPELWNKLVALGYRSHCDPVGALNSLLVPSGCRVLPTRSWPFAVTVIFVY